MVRCSNDRIVRCYWRRWLITRYTRPAMGRIWSDENKYRMWLEVEATASETLAEARIVPHSAAKAIRAYGDVDVARIQEIEAEVKHDVIAFTTALLRTMWSTLPRRCRSKRLQGSFARAFLASQPFSGNAPWNLSTHRPLG